MADYRFEKVDSNQFDSLIPLMRHCFRMEVNIEYFKWKFIDNPAGKFVGFAAIDEKTNETAAFFSVIPEEYVIDSKKRTIYQACEAMTHSNHRRKGLFEMLVNKCNDYLKENNELFVIAFGGATSTPAFLKFGWKHIFELRKPFIPNILCYSAFFKSFPDSNFEIISDIGRLEGLFGRKPENNAKIYSLRNKANVEWRYKNPLNHYETLAYKGNSGSEIKGYISYYINRNKLFIFDFVFATSNSRKALIGNLKGQIIKKKLSGIVGFCQENSLEERALKQSGFLVNSFGRGPLSEKTHFTIYADEKTMNEYDNPDLWAVKGYDHDSY